MNKIFLLSILLLNYSTQAQKKSDPQTFASTITVDDLKKHLYIIAGKEMEGRETATEGQRKAAAYIEKEFKRMGLLPASTGSYQLQFPVYQDSLTNSIFEVNGQKYILDKDYNVNLNNIKARQAFSEAAYIGPGVPLDSIKPGSLIGKLVIISGESGNIGGRRVSARLSAIRNANPASILYVDTNYPRKTVTSKIGNQALNIFKRYLNPQQFNISQNIAKAIIGSRYADSATFNTPVIFQSNILLEVQNATNRLQSSNVIGVLPGTDLKNEYLFITAHYDHLGKRDTVIYYGADDDGSGTVGVLELAEAWSKAKAAGKGPRRTIVFLTVSGEEKGLWGSEYYTNNPVYPLNKVTADLNMDMIGRHDNRRMTGDSNNYVYIVGDDKISTELKTINEAQNKKYLNLELDYKYNDPNDRERIYFRSDHYNFAKNGVPIIFYTDGMQLPDYHRATDTPDKINYNLLLKRAQLVFYTAWEMANRDNMLKRDLPVPTQQRRAE